MKRIEQKVKDLIELRPYSSGYDFAKEPAKALASYHFTDITADLMAKWLDKAGQVTSGSGGAFALAGFRGVGKSHFLTTFGAIIGIPDVRSRIGDTHVDSAAHRLGRRKFEVAWVHRGTQPTLVDELRMAIAAASGVSEGTLGSSLTELLGQAAKASVEGPPILVIDTALDRTERVTRDDGAVLGEVAELAKSLGIFVALALDDDIAGADGANAAITRSFTIDYLDQEHLYKIVDAHIFPKHARSQAVLHEIYEYYRSVVPGFRWSEQRFAALYPLHPSIMEVAPFVRLYLHEFALLGFAAEAGARIMGRPANSLIAPDEVFDNVETSLRGVEELAGAFDIYDRLNKEVVANTPVLKRLQAKLILKGLLLFSLNEEGTTAAEIGASMLIFDEGEPTAAIAEIGTVLEAFATNCPDAIRAEPDASGTTRYSFRLDAKDDLKQALQASARRVGEENIGGLLKRLHTERFPDCTFRTDADGISLSTADGYLLWRGGVRKGEVVWNYADAEPTPSEGSSFDWRVVISGTAEAEATGAGTTVGWIPGKPSPEDTALLSRYWLLLNDPEIRANYKEHLATASQTHAAGAAKVFQRLFLDEAVLSIGGFEYNLTEEARAAGSLSQLFTVMLEPLFEGRFPQHPLFPHVVGMREVSVLATDFFGGTTTSADPDMVQRIAAACCTPLGIATQTPTGLVPASAVDLGQLDLVRLVMESVEKGGLAAAKLTDVRTALGSAPYGLVTESVYLLLTAMVSAKMLEFVTTRGDRINHRSLDLQLIWDDIDAVARPEDAGYSAERLGTWLNLLTGADKTLSPAGDADHSAIADALAEWLASWRRSSVAVRYSELDDCLLTAAIWRAAFSIRPFESVATQIEMLRDERSTISECLGAIADAFSDSEAEFERRSSDVARVEEFIAGTELRREVFSYLAMCEVTGIDEIDSLRTGVWVKAHIGRSTADEEANRSLRNAWGRFHKLYASYFTDLHNTLPAQADLRDKLSQIKKTDVWWEFETLSATPSFDHRAKIEIRDAMETMRRLDCHRDIDAELKVLPACGCGFSLGGTAILEDGPRDLWQAINKALLGHRHQLRDRLEDIRRLTSTSFTRQDIDSLSDLIQRPDDFRRFSEAELRVLRTLSAHSENSSPRREPEPTLSPQPTTAEVDAMVESLN